jgi:hypothetical protein
LVPAKTLLEKSDDELVADMAQRRLYSYCEDPDQFDDLDDIFDTITKAARKGKELDKEMMLEMIMVNKHSNVYHFDSTHVSSTTTHNTILRPSFPTWSNRRTDRRASQVGRAGWPAGLASLAGVGGPGCRAGWPCGPGWQALALARVWLQGWPSRAGKHWWQAWLADFSTEIFVVNVAVGTCKYTEYTKIIILTIGLDAHGPGDVNFITQILLTPPGDGAVISLRKYQ